jgi:hypothetical protein
MESSRLIVIGGGAAGMVCAIAAAGSGAEVVLLEKMEKPGRKILITGKGRCNITNKKPWAEFSSHINPNKKFLKHSFHAFSNKDTIDFFESLGLQCNVERGDRVFPASGKSSSVVEVLVKEMERLKVIQHYNTPVHNLLFEGGVITGVNTSNGVMNCSAVVVATGGLSYPSTGSQGDGYTLAREAGHTITPLFPSLTALMPSGFNGEAKGLTLKNIALDLFVGNDLVQHETGDIDFTNNGIEGPLGFRVSRKAVKAMDNGNRCFLSIDLKPAVGPNELLERVKREIGEFRGNSLFRFLSGYMPSQIISSFVSDNNLPDLMPDGERREDFAKKICSALKSWKTEIVSYTSYERAVVTAGGVCLDEVFPKTMKSRLCDNLFFAGEVLDLDGDTGGYNLQIAFSTGYRAGVEAAHLTKKWISGE